MAGDNVTASTIGGLYILYCRNRLSREYLPRILRCLGELDDAGVWWRTHETDNSIGNLILHLSGNVEQWINSGLGEGVADGRDRPSEFSERRRLPKATLAATLTATLDRADRTLEKFDPARLTERRVIQGFDVTCLEALSHVVEHFAQHLGQVIYITKLRTGTDLKFYDL